MRKVANQRMILWVLCLVMIFNIGLSVYIELEKEAMLRGESTDVCFADSSEGNCSDVQLSEYGSIFGISVAIWGAVCFSFMAILLASIAYSIKNKFPIMSEQDIESTIKFAGISFAIATLGAAYFIVLQFFVIGAICKYCMIIDSLTIICTIIFFATFKKGVDFYSI